MLQHISHTFVESNTHPSQVIQLHVVGSRSTHCNCRLMMMAMVAMIRSREIHTCTHMNTQDYHHESYSHSHSDTHRRMNEHKTHIHTYLSILTFCDTHINTGCFFLMIRFRLLPVGLILKISTCDFLQIVEEEWQFFSICNMWPFTHYFFLNLKI